MATQVPVDPRPAGLLLSDPRVAAQLVSTITIAWLGSNCCSNVVNSVMDGITWLGYRALLNSSAPILGNDVNKSRKHGLSALCFLCKVMCNSRVCRCSASQLTIAVSMTCTWSFAVSPGLANLRLPWCRRNPEVGF